MIAPDRAVGQKQDAQPLASSSGVSPLARVPACPRQLPFSSFLNQIFIFVRQTHGQRKPCSDHPSEAWIMFEKRVALTWKRLALLAMLAGGLLCIVACGGQPGGDSAGGGDGPTSIAIDGSSTVYPVTEAVAEEFQIEKKGQTHVTVGISGTGGGFKKFVRGETDISNASRPILQEEMDLAKAAGIEYIELPICFDALTVVVHPENDWVDSITVDELKKIWAPESQENVTKWSQVRDGWPDEQIALFGAGAESGTFDYFTEAIVGKAKSSRVDYTDSEDDNTLVQGVSSNKYALGYLPFSYYITNKDKLKALSIDWEQDGTGPVEPSLENVVKGVYNPLSRPLFLYVSLKAAERKEVADFIDFYIDNVAALAKEVHYLPFDDATNALVKERFEKRVTGSVFDGKPEVGVPVEDILKRETSK
jgi:phosphate transport system substrate-binding protein